MKAAQTQQDGTQKAVCGLAVPLVSELRTSNFLGRCQLWSPPSTAMLFPHKHTLNWLGKASLR